MLEKMLKNCDIKISIEKGDDEYILSSEAFFEDGEQILVYAYEQDGKVNLSDGGQSLDYISRILDIDSKDVYISIKKVLKIYNLELKGTEIICTDVKEKEIGERFFDMLMCSSQISNMHIFFEE